MRIIDLTKYGKQNVSFYLAMERHFLNAPEWRDEEFFFIWDINPAIVCGKHQLIENEVNLDYVRKIGVPIYRRHSGGGTIFADEGCFMFTFIRRSTKRDEVFRECLTSIVDAFKEIGLETELSGRNDLLFRDKKFSGNAYYRNENGSILHGTLLYNTDIEQLVRTITPDNEKLISKGIESVRQRVINVGEYTSLSRTELMRHLETFIVNNNFDFEQSEKSSSVSSVGSVRDKNKSVREGSFSLQINESDYAAIKAIEPEYLTHEWLWGNNPPYTYSNKQRFSWGVIEARIDVKGGKIRTIEFCGDFFTHQDLQPLYELFIGNEFTLDEIKKVLHHINITDYILGATADDLLSLMQK